MLEIKRGDRVFLATDPRRDQGIVESVRGQGAIIMVFWERTRRRWPYQPKQLRRVTP